MNRLFVGIARRSSSARRRRRARPSRGCSGRLPAADFLVAQAETGRPGGQLVVVQRAEPRTLNPVTAVDAPSRDVIRRMHADLIHINRETQRTEPALAKSWKVSPDGRRYTLSLRRGVPVLRRPSVRRRRCGVLVSRLPRREGGVAAAGSADRRRQADRGAEAGSADGAVRSERAVRRRPSGSSTASRCCRGICSRSPTRKAGWPRRGA